ncbi:hypothetical protein DPMN_016042 [Dreissena polymorpha]|uniref:Uncharacterized protein n=2 Tax=Dreissena polymorpha TaxID=45954 RepID=A0A9D4S6S2_DREPO|nr:hypothetical protein DPMN_016042 [Dreissena polymorpha]
MPDDGREYWQCEGCFKWFHRNVLVSQWNQKSTSAHHVHTSEPYYSVVKQLRGVKDPNLKAYLAKDK